MPRTILITGATGALGRTAVGAAVDSGAQVHLVGRDDERLRDVARLRPDGVAGTHVLDVADARTVDQLAMHIGAEVDVVWHLVGGWRGGQPLPEQPLADWDWLHDQLARTTANLARAFAGTLADRATGRFAIVSSPLALAPTSTNAAYAAAKAAAEITVLALADHFKGTTATANIVIVPSIGTTSPSAVSPDDVVTALLYLTSDAAAKMNGQRIRLHAGGPS